ncbi:MAG: metallopeptidase TldD-related protein, partial [Vulcanimicrobiaceae bacterium]
SFAHKVALLSAIDAYGRARDPRVAQISASLHSEYKIVEILRGDGAVVRDVRPLVRLDVSVTLERDGRRETGFMGAGGRAAFTTWVAFEHWRAQVDEAFRLAEVALEAEPCPAGEMDVVVGPGWNGVLLHEAVGHGLEGDFNRKGVSAFSGRLGERVAARGVTVFDDGSIAERRGSLTIDDEGTPTERTILIEDGILVGYMHDRMSARLMGMKATGNGRRESFAHMPMPRMRGISARVAPSTPGSVLARRSMSSMVAFISGVLTPAMRGLTTMAIRLRRLTPASMDLKRSRVRTSAAPPISSMVERATCRATSAIPARERRWRGPPRPIRPVRSARNKWSAGTMLTARAV